MTIGKSNNNIEIESYIPNKKCGLIGGGRIFD